MVVSHTNITKRFMETNYSSSYSNNHSWLIIGDLNELVNPNEKSSETKGNSSRYAKFNNSVQSKNLIDLRYICKPVTWYNKRDVEGAVFSSLDCALVTVIGLGCTLIIGSDCASHVTNYSVP